MITTMLVIIERNDKKILIYIDGEHIPDLSFIKDIEILKDDRDKSVCF